jgi:glycosyltransferase involved in cell wall biosynthesis
MAHPIRVLELRSVRGTGGGPEKTIMLGAAQSNRDLFDVTVCYIRDGRDDAFRLHERATKLGITYVEVHERHSFDIRIWSQLRKLVEDRRIDIVHAHEYKTDALALLLARRTGVIPVATAHAWTGQTARERHLYYPLDKRLLTQFPHVIAVSTDIKRELVRHGTSAHRITVILNSIDPLVFKRVTGRRESVRRELDYSSEHVVIGAVGRLERQKRFDLLIEAVAALVPRHPNLRVALVGDGSLRGHLAALAARLDLSGYFSFLGHRDDIVDLYQAFDVFVQSSEYEGTPNAVLEAMAMETPLIATDVGGTRELSTPDVHGKIIPRHDVQALQSAIEAVLTDPEAARIRAAAARRRVEAELSFEARTRRLEAIYHQLVHDRTEARRHA